MKTLYRTCCICANSSCEVYRTIGEYTLFKCKKCTLIFLRDYFEKDIDFISHVENKKVEFWSTPKLFKKYKKIFYSFYKIRLNRIRKYTDKINFLDIGAGYGFWHNYLLEHQYNCHSVEPDNDCCIYARNEFGLPNYHQARFEDFAPGCTYDVITLIDVLEHFENPRDIIKSAYLSLNDSGIMFIQVPNVTGFKIPWGHNWGLPFHLWQFNKKSLYCLLRECGFEPLEYWTGVQGVIGKLEQGGPSHLDYLKWFVGKKIKLGNRLQVIARKSLVEEHK